MRRLLFPFLVALCPNLVLAQGTTPYAKAQELVKQYPQLAKLKPLGQTASGKPCYALVLGNPAEADKPALCVIAGTRRDYAYTTTLALTMAQMWLENPAVLSKHTIYILPEASPEELALAGRNGNSVNTYAQDDDRDARMDEDGPNDVNGDGFVDKMRYPDPAGPWAVHPKCPEVLLPWQKVVEAGYPNPIRYQLHAEGTDDDQDGKYNEDGTGGTAFEQNWTWNYRWFAPGSGPHPVSEPETRAVADFLFAQPNIVAVCVLGPHTNLTEAWKEQLGDAKLPQSKLAATDLKTYQLLAQYYAKQVATPHLATEDQPGLLHWLHFHYGRWALGTPGWRPTYDPKSDSLPEGLRTPEYKLAKWYQAQKLSLPFSPWTAYKGQQLPAPEVEIGGWYAFDMWAPPADSLRPVAMRHTGYLSAVLDLYPRIDVKPELKQLDASLWQLTLCISNAGTLPTHTDVGGTHPHTQALVCQIDTDAQLVAGLKRTNVPVLAPGEVHTLQFILNGNKDSKLTYMVHSPQTGKQTLTLPLK